MYVLAIPYFEFIYTFSCLVVVFMLRDIPYCLHTIQSSICLGSIGIIWNSMMLSLTRVILYHVIAMK